MSGKSFAPKRIIKLRREFSLPGYKNLEDVKLDGDYVTPLQIAAHSKTGPCLVAYNWIDAPTAIKHRDFLAEYGYLPDITFNKVLELAFKQINIRREDTYMTQAFHLLPSNKRSSYISRGDLRESFNKITLHEIRGRKVIALGNDADYACKPYEDQYLNYVKTIHPSSRIGSHEKKAAIIAKAIQKAL
ncbi:MAG: hypothetical protein OXF29_09215 [Hyphomicrobiales bacterium]|nr:hypothetical protein [Hyphomicrobiales bacterium]